MGCGCDDRGPVALTPTKDPCGCTDEKPAPGVIRVSVNRGNIDRNRLVGIPVTLPAIMVEQDGRRTYADRVEFLGPAVVIQDDSVRPAVWIETTHPVVATVEGKKT